MVENLVELITSRSAALKRPLILSIPWDDGDIICAALA